MPHLLPTACLIGGLCLTSAAYANGAGPSARSYEFGLFQGHGTAVTLRDPETVVGRSPRPNFDGNSTRQLLSLIAFAEAGPDGYDAVQHGAHQLPRLRPTKLTLSEILSWIEATPGQPHAIGRYQFIPETLRRLAAESGLSGATVFTPEVQDILGTLLLEEAGLSEFLSGTITREAFMDRLALIWAGLPTRNGLSAYEGYAGNRATITRTEFAARLAEIYPRIQR